MPKTFEGDAFAASRMMPWGLGVFPRTLVPIIQGINPEEFRAIPDKEVFSRHGFDILEKIEREIAGKGNSGDLRSVYYQILNDMPTVFPRQSLTHNIGNDGSGNLQERSSRFDNRDLWEKTCNFSFERNIQVDIEIQKSMTAFWNRGLYGLFIRMLSRIGLYSLAKAIFVLGRDKWLPGKLS